MSKTTVQRPWRMVMPLALVLLLFALWSGYWLFANAEAQKLAAAERAKLATRGIALACDSESWSGYPFRFEFACTTPRLTLPDGALIGSTSLLAVAQAYNPMHVIILLYGPTTAIRPSGESRDIAHGRVTVSIAAHRDGTAELQADIPGVNASGHFAAKDVQLYTRPAKDRANDIAITLEQPRLEFPGKPPLALDHAQLLGTLTAAHEFDISNVEMQQGALKLWGQGKLQLDAAHRIEGRLSLATNGLDGVMTMLDPYINLSDHQRVALKTVLGLMSHEAKADLVAEDGELFIGPVKIGKLKPLY